MFFEEKFKSFLKSPHVFGSHLNSLGSQEVFKLVTYPVVHLSSFQTKILPPNPIFSTKTKLIPTRKLRTMTSFLWHFSIQY